MSELDVLTYGFPLMTDQGPLGFSTISLLTLGDSHILVDTGPAGRRSLLYKALQSRDLSPDDIDIVILTHMHWDHCQNTDLFRNARILLHPRELDYARNPNRGDFHVAWHIAETLDKMKVEPVSDGDSVVEGVSIIDTPGHTKGHISVLATVDGEGVLVAGDALPDGGTIRRGVPYNIFWDVSDARESVEKMLASSEVFYPGHDRPFRLEGDQISYLHGPAQVEVSTSNEGGGVTALTYRVHSHREVNIELVQKG